MDYTRTVKLHNKIVSTAQNSREREQAVSALSEADLHGLFDYDVGCRSGRIKGINDNKQEGNIMTFEQYKNKMNSDERGSMLQVSQFAMENPELYQKYRERYLQERDKERRSHNQRLTENKFKNKPYSIK